MTDTEHAGMRPLPLPPPPGPGPLRLTVWDAPNMDMSLGTVLGARPGQDTRPDYTAVATWLCRRAPAVETIEAVVFANIPPGAEERMGGWVIAVRQAGFGVYARPKNDADSDVDEAMVALVEARRDEGELAELIVASHDARCFGPVADDLTADGTVVTVLGYRELLTGYRDHDVTVVDIEDVPGAFSKPLPRSHLFDLPAEGRWLPPLTLLTPSRGTDG
ncbi:MAG: NYN domain-containing protein [Actinomycetota bacterium]|nr:NYN domain-containing protein [Actinomycetota bacterium]